LIRRGRDKLAKLAPSTKTEVRPLQRKGTYGWFKAGLHDLYGRAKALFDLVAPQEYGFNQEAKEEIGVLTSLPLLRKVWEDLDEARTTGKSLACFYFT